ncbi:MAG: hypothetical protein K2M31_04980 [Muribaculaceae bacterium]|nr:hypothetical protein [Muribaculaceae bacterium]
MTEFSIFALSKSAIFDKIRLFTSYLAGKRASDAVGYDRIAAIEIDIPLLSLIVGDAAAFLAAKLGDRMVAMEIDSDIISFRLKNPKGEQKVIFNLMESYVVAKTIVEWLRIVDYDFAGGPVSAMKSAEEAAESKLKLLQEALSDLPEPSRTHASKASPRRLPPI